MDTLSISPAQPTPAPQPAASTASTASIASNAADKAAETASVAKVAQDRKKTEATAETESSNAPARDSRSLQYLVQGNRVITTIVDDQSKKVVVQIPDAELIRIAKSIDRMQGFFIEQDA